MEYRRLRLAGATYFFTVVTFERLPLFADADNVALLRRAFETVKARHPFVIDALVLLPDHLHCLWTLPQGDDDFSSRWMSIKREFTRHCPERHKSPVSPARRAKREQAVWQQRFGSIASATKAIFNGIAITSISIRSNTVTPPPRLHGRIRHSGASSNAACIRPIGAE